MEEEWNRQYDGIEFGGGLGCSFNFPCEEGGGRGVSGPNYILPVWHEFCTKIVPLLALAMLNRDKNYGVF